MKRFIALALILGMVPFTMGARLTRDNTARFGDSSAGTAKVLKFGPSGQVLWSGSKMQFSNDNGVNKVDIGTGGGGAAGINILATQNGDMETVSGGKPSSWTESGSSVLATEATNVHDGAAAASWDASASGETLKSAAVNIDANEFGGLKGDTCTISAYYLSTGISSGDVKMEAVDGSSNVLRTVDLEPTQANTWQHVSISFPCPFGTTLQTEFEATTNAAVILIDSVFMGRNDLFKVSQPAFVGAALTPTTASCSWVDANAAFAAHAVNSNCPVPTLVGNVQAPDTKIPGFKYNFQADVEYVIEATGYFVTSTNANERCAWTFNDGTSNFGRHYVNGSQVTAGGQHPDSLFRARYRPSTGGLKTIQLYSKRKLANASCAIYVADSDHQLEFRVYEFPIKNRDVTTFDQAAASWSGNHGSDCSFSRTNTAYGDPSADSTCTFTERTNTNFGTVASYLSGSDPLPGIVLNMNHTGNLWVCAILDNRQGGAGIASFQLIEGAHVLAAKGHTVGSAVTVSTPLCGILPVTSTGAKTIKVQSKVSTGTIYIENGGGSANPAIDWSVVDISKNLPAGYFVNTVVSPYEGVTTSIHAHVSATCSSTPCTIASQSGGITSIARTGTGAYTVNYSGVFSDRPWSCTCNSFALNRRCAGVSVDPTSSAYQFTTVDNAGGQSDGSFFVTCTGPK